MAEECSTLLVKRVGGFIRRKGKSPLMVLVDGKHAGSIGEEIELASGSHCVVVKTFLFTCRPLQIEVAPMSKHNLQYQSSWLALAFVGLGVFLFLVLAFPVVFLLEHLQLLIAGDFVPPIIGLVFLIAIFAVYGGFAFVAPPRIFSLFGIFSHWLTPSSLLEKD